MTLYLNVGKGARAGCSSSSSSGCLSVSKRSFFVVAVAEAGQLAGNHALMSPTLLALDSSYPSLPLLMYRPCLATSPPPPPRLHCRFPDTTAPPPHMHAPAVDRPPSNPGPPRCKDFSPSNLVNIAAVRPPAPGTMFACAHVPGTMFLPLAARSLTVTACCQLHVAAGVPVHPEPSLSFAVPVHPEPSLS